MKIREFAFEAPLAGCPGGEGRLDKDGLGVPGHEDAKKPNSAQKVARQRAQTCIFALSTL